MNVSIVCQVLPVAEQCITSHLLRFRYTSTEFAVVCTDQSLHFATINSSSLSLRKLTKNYNDNSVIVEVDSQLMIVSYVGYNTVNMRDVNDASPEILRLPSNINCRSDPVLYPRPMHKAFFMHCETQEGKTLYEVKIPVHRNSTARGIPADGDPYFSLEGTYAVIVKGKTARVYVVDDLSKEGFAVTFPSGDISDCEFLDDSNASVLTTAASEHYVVNVGNSSSRPRHFRDGSPPFLSEWVDGFYIYATESDGVSRISVVNKTSTDAMYETEGIVDEPEKLVFYKRRVQHNAGYNGKGTNVATLTILPSVLGGAVFLVLVILVVSGITCLITRYRPQLVGMLQRRYQRLPAQRTPTPPPATPPPTTPPPATPPPPTQEEADPNSIHISSQGNRVYDLGRHPPAADNTGTNEGNSTSENSPASRQLIATRVNSEPSLGQDPNHDLVKTLPATQFTETARQEVPDSPRLLPPLEPFDTISLASNESLPLPSSTQALEHSDSDSKDRQTAATGAKDLPPFVEQKSIPRDTATAEFYYDNPRDQTQ